MSNELIECRGCKHNAVKVVDVKVTIREPFCGQDYIYSQVCTPCMTSPKTLAKFGALKIEVA